MLSTPIMRRPGAEQYPHWDRVRFLTPPAGLSREEWWLLDHGKERNKFVFTVPADLAARLRHLAGSNS